MLVRNILSDMQPDAPPFGSLDGWFMHFKARHRINKRQATIPVRRSHMTSEVPFSSSIAPSTDLPRRESKLGHWEGGLLVTFPNMD